MFLRGMMSAAVAVKRRTRIAQWPCFMGAIALAFARFAASEALADPKVERKGQPGSPADSSRVQEKPSPKESQRRLSRNVARTLPFHPRQSREGRSRYQCARWYDQQSMASAVDAAFQQGVVLGRSSEGRKTYPQHGETPFRRMMQEGHEAFEAGDYSAAARQFLLASILNQGDATSRLCAAHAQAALGNFTPAADLIRRAIGLQPRLAYLPLDIRDSYGSSEDFENHIARIQASATSAPHDADLQFLQGYYCFFSGRIKDAAVALRTAHDLRPQDRSIHTLQQAASLLAGRPLDRVTSIPVQARP